jgi:hypothetical protein
MLSPQQKAKNLKFMFIHSYNRPSWNFFSPFFWKLAIIFSNLMFLVNVVCLILCFLYNNDNFFYDYINIINISNLSCQVILWLFALTGAISKNFNMCYYSTLILNVIVYIETILAVVFLFAINWSAFYSKRSDNERFKLLTEFLNIGYILFFYFSTLLFFHFTKMLGANISDNSRPLLHSAPSNPIKTYNQSTGTYISASNPRTDVRLNASESNNNNYSSADTNLINNKSNAMLIHQDLTLIHNSQNEIVNDVTLFSGGMPNGNNGNS